MESSDEISKMDLGMKVQRSCTSSEPESRETPVIERKVLIPLEDPSVTMLCKDAGALIDLARVIVCDEGGIYSNLTHGLTVQIPSGAIPSGLKLEISIGVLLHGNFIFPAELSPVSAIVWLCTANPKFIFSKSIRIFIPHCMECKDDIEAAHLQMQFMKASHFSSNADSLEFSTADGIQDFGTATSKGILQTSHLCYLCIAAGKTRIHLQNKKLCISCAVPYHITAPSKIHFFVTYFFPTCIELIRLKLPEEYFIAHQRLFTYQSQSDAISDEYLTSSTACVVALHPSKISHDSVDFWELHIKGDLQDMEDTGLYPPRMVLEIVALPSTAVVIKVTFHGTKEAEEEMMIAITVPNQTTTRPGREVLMSTSSSGAYGQEATLMWIADTPTVKQLQVIKCEKKSPIRLVQDIAHKWEELGYALDFDPKGSHVKLIKKDYAIEGSVACCYRVLMDWLDGKGACQPPTWAKLIEILEDIDERRLAQEIKDIVSH